MSPLRDKPLWSIFGNLENRRILSRFLESIKREKYLLNGKIVLIDFQDLIKPDDLSYRFLQSVNLNLLCSH